MRISILLKTTFIAVLIALTGGTTRAQSSTIPTVDVQASAEVNHGIRRRLVFVL